MVLRECGILFEFRSEIKEIHLQNVQTDIETADFMDGTFPQIRTVTFSNVNITDCSTAMAASIFTGFFQSNPTIRVLCLMNTKTSLSTLNAICTSLRSLDSLTIRLNVVAHVSKLHQLAYLPRLILDIPKKAWPGLLLSLLSRKGNLTHLDIKVSDHTYEEFFETISYLDSLENFVLRRTTHFHSNHYLEKTLRRMKNLTVFRSNCFQIEDHDVIIRIIENNPKLNVFWLGYIYRQTIMIDVPKIELLANKNNRPSTAPKLVILLIGCCTQKLMFQVTDNVVIVYSTPISMPTTDGALQHFCPHPIQPIC